jgi:hypothetical protein
MGIGFPHDHLIGDCGSRTKKGNGEWGMGNGVKEVISQLPTLYSPLPIPLLHPQSLPNPVSLV